MGFSSNKLLERLSPTTRKKTDNCFSDPSSNSLGGPPDIIRDLAKAPTRVALKAAPPATGMCETRSCLVGSPDAKVNLLAAQTVAVIRAKAALTPVASRKPYNIQPAGHPETARWISEPNNTGNLNRLLAERDWAERRKTSFDPMSGLEYDWNAATGAPRLPRFNKVAGGFVPFGPLSTAVMDTGSSDSEIKTAHEADVSELPEKTDTEHSFDDGPATNDTDDDGCYPLSQSRWSSSSSEASDTSDEDVGSELDEEVVSDDIDVETVWVDDDDINDEVASGIQVTEAKETRMAKEIDPVNPREGAVSRLVKGRPKQVGLPVTVYADLNAVPVDFEARADTVIPAPRPAATRSSSHERVPESVEKQVKYHYTTSEAAKRLDYIKKHLLLDVDISPEDVVCYYLMNYRKTFADAGSRNPILVRAGEEIDWSGILDDVPYPDDADDALILFYRNLMSAWLERGPHLFHQLDDYGEYEGDMSA